MAPLSGSAGNKVLVAARLERSWLWAFVAPTVGVVVVGILILAPLGIVGVVVVGVGVLELGVELALLVL